MAIWWFHLHLTVEKKKRQELVPLHFTSSVTPSHILSFLSPKLSLNFKTPPSPLVPKVNCWLGPYNSYHLVHFTWARMPSSYLVFSIQFQNHLLNLNTPTSPSVPHSTLLTPYFQLISFTSLPLSQNASLSFSSITIITSISSQQIKMRQATVTTRSAEWMGVVLKCECERKINTKCSRRGSQLCNTLGLYYMRGLSKKKKTHSCIYIKKKSENNYVPPFKNIPVSFLNIEISRFLKFQNDVIFIY